MGISRHKVIVVGSGHAGAEAAWAAANLLRADLFGPGSVALVTLDPAKTGVMSCNPAIGGLAKGQIVREIDAMGGVMGLAADATGIQFKVLNTSKGPAVRGPRAQCDKHAYAEAVQRLLHGRPEIQVYAGAVEELLVESARGGRVIRGVRLVPSTRIAPPTSESRDAAATFANPLILPGAAIDLFAEAVVLTTGTFMRGLMHTGEQRTAGGRAGEGAAGGISAALGALGFELGRLKTGTPPRLNRGTINWDALPAAWGDDHPTPFSDLPAGRLSEPMSNGDTLANRGRRNHGSESRATFPVLPQVDCRVTHTCEAIHDHIRANIHRAPMFSGQIESVGPRYCPSIEDKVVRFAQRGSHHVFLEPESLRDDWIYCNGISTSLPADVQDFLVRSMPGCERAEILRYGYAVEYDMVRPHQIDATGMTKRIGGLFLAGQINGTSGYEEAAGQGLIAGVNAARRALGEDPVTLGRDQAYIGVLMDDLVTKTPVEPYRMFTSRAEHRLHLRADNSADRLTPLAESWGLLDTILGRERTNLHARRRDQIEALTRLVHAGRCEHGILADACRRPQFGPDDLRAAVAALPGGGAFDEPVIFTVHTDLRYEAYLARSRAEIRRHAEIEHKPIPTTVDYRLMTNLRAEAREALDRFRPATMGQASRLEGITPADLTLLSVLLKGYSGGVKGGGRLATPVGDERPRRDVPSRRSTAADGA